MKIVVPVTTQGLDPAVERTLLTQAGIHGLTVTCWPMVKTESYWEMMSALWAEEETFMVVEHDIVVHEFVIPTFEDCPEPFCAFGYPYAICGDSLWYGSGCRRFRDTVMRSIPDAFENIGTYENDKHPPKHWCALDTWIQRELGWRGFPQHKHDPPVGHLNTGPPSHGCRTL